MSARVVIDANLLFSALISANSRLRKAFSSMSQTEFYCPKYVLVRQNHGQTNSLAL
jgi:hypothetical protein